MSNKTITIKILPELPVGAIFKFEGKREKYKVVEVPELKVLTGDSRCDGCDLLSVDGDDRRCQSFICAGLERVDRTYVRAESMKGKRK